MKNLLVLGSILMLTLVACQKNNKQIRPNIYTDYSQGKEVTYAPESKEEGHKQTMNFLNHTKYGHAKKRTTFPNINAQMAAWLFESGANYLENPNAVRIESMQQYTIEVDLIATGEISGIDLTNEFNTLINAIESVPGQTPRIINVYFWGSEAEKVLFRVDVYNGDDPIGQVVFPTTDQNYCTAANILTSAMNEYIYYQYVQFTQQTGTSVYFNSLAQIPLGYNHAIIGDGFLENLLWISSKANGGDPHGNFKASDFSQYYQNYKDVVNWVQPLINKGVVAMQVDCEDFTINTSTLNGGYYGYNHTYYTLNGAYVPVNSQ